MKEKKALIQKTEVSKEVTLSSLKENDQFSYDGAIHVIEKITSKTAVVAIEKQIQNQVEPGVFKDAVIKVSRSTLPLDTKVIRR